MIFMVRYGDATRNGSLSRVLQAETWHHASTVALEAGRAANRTLIEIQAVDPTKLPLVSAAAWLPEDFVLEVAKIAKAREPLK